MKSNVTKLIKGLRGVCIALSILGIYKNSKAQISSTGTEFYMTFLEMETRTGWGGNSNPYPDTLLLFVTSDYDTKVTVDNPRLTGSAVSYNITKNKVNRIAVDNVYYYPKGSEFSGTDQNAKKGLRLVSKAPVNVYCMNLELNRSDGTFVLPKQSIPAAPEFFIPAFSPNVGSGSYTESEFAIVAMDNGVKVEITPSVVTKGGKAAGKPFTISMGKGQVYQVQSDPSDGTRRTDPAAYSWTGGGAKAGDLTGTRVRVINGCGKINVFSGQRSAYTPKENCRSGFGITGRDHLYTQVLPTNALGKKYVVMPFANQSDGYVYRVIAAKDKTTVKINGSTYTTIPKAGDWITIDVGSGTAAVVETSEPAYLAQYMKCGRCNGMSGNDGDPALFISPDANQRLLKTIVGTATTSNMRNHWVNILVDKNATHAVKLNGTFLNKSQFTNVGSQPYAYAQVKVQNPSSNVIECDSGFVCTAYGTGPYESYAYSAGALFENVEYDFLISRKGKCPSEPVKLKAEYIAKNVQGIRWNFGDGTEEEEGDSLIHSFEKVGTYYIVMKAIVKNNCDKIDTVYRSKIINVLPGPIFDFEDTTIQCADKLDIVMEAPESKKFLYKWQDSSTSSTFNVTSDMKLWLRVLDTSTNCVAIDSSYVMRANLIHAGITEDSVVRCAKENVFRLTDGTTYDQDSWKSSEWEVIRESNGQYVQSQDSLFTISFDSVSVNDMRYIVESQKGCRDTLDTALVVYPYPIARIALPFGNYCEQNESIFIDSSYSPTGRYISYWDFGNGDLDTNYNASVDSSIRYVFPDSATLKVQLITETDYGCRDTIDSTVVVNPIAEAVIDIRILDACLGNNEFELNDNTVFGGTFDDEWIVEGKSYPSQGSLKTTFSDTGTHEVMLITETDLGCLDTATDNVFVSPEPTAILTVTDSSQCFDNHYFKLECQSTAASNATLNSRSDWYFSDNTSTYAKIIPGKTFSTPGTYTVKLVVGTTDGCLDSAERDLVVFEEPDATITPDNGTQCVTGNVYRFLSKTPWSDPNITVTHYWNVGDGTFTDKDSIIHTYSSEGTYDVFHIIKTDKGCEDSAVTKAFVVSSPTVNFTSNKDTACLYSQKFNLINQTNYTGSFTSQWDLGDGNVLSSDDVLGKDYTTPGMKMVKLIVTSDQGCKDSISKPLEVFSVPTTSFSINTKTQCLDGNSFVFNNVTNENGNANTNYQWAIFGKSPTSYTGKDIPNQILADTGWHDVILTAINDNNCQNSYSDKIYVAETPQVSIVGRNHCQGESLQWGHNLVLNNGTASYAWSFGNGGVSSQPNPNFTYTQAGDYTVQLTVTSSFGCVGKANDFPVSIFTKPTASFDSEYLLSRGLETDWKFAYTGTGADQLLWLFEDGQNDVGLAPVFKTFSATGDFGVTLQASTANGCRDSSSQTIFLKPELLMWIPNVFTPNIDGLNDDFGPNVTFGLEKYRLRIYDRWGNKVFETEDPENRWTGLDPNGEPIMPGMYAYQMYFRYVDNKLYVYKGTVLVERP